MDETRFQEAIRKMTMDEKLQLIKNCSVFDWKKLSILANDSNKFVRMYVAKAKYTSCNDVEKLAEDADDDVRLAAIESRKLMEKTLRRLRYDSCWFVAEKAKQILKEIEEYDKRICEI